MNALKKQLESQVRVQYQDCDPFNHLNNSRYIDYIMAARTEQLLENYGFNSSELAKGSGIGWVAAQTQVSYIFPAVWMEKVTIETRLIAFSSASITVEAIMWNEKKTHMKAVMWAKFVHFNITTQRSHKHSNELMRFFSEIHSPIEDNPTFEIRVKSLKQLIHLPQ